MTDIKKLFKLPLQNKMFSLQYLDHFLKEDDEIIILEYKYFYCKI